MTVPTNVGEALLADILREPDDDGLRLIYADWLQDNGQPERGEYVRLGVAYASLLATPGLSAAEQAGRVSSRMEAILDATPWGHGWWADMPTWVVESRADRGFVGTVKANLADWLKHGPRLVQREHPVERVEVADRELSVVNDHGRASYGWFTSGDPAGHDMVPGFLFGTLGRVGLVEDGGDASVERLRWKLYTTPEAARAALSAACLAWARGVKCLECNDTGRPLDGKPFCLICPAGEEVYDARRKDGCTDFAGTGAEARERQRQWITRMDGRSP